MTDILSLVGSVGNNTPQPSDTTTAGKTLLFDPLSYDLSPSPKPAVKSKFRDVRDFVSSLVANQRSRSDGDPTL